MRLHEYVNESSDDIIEICDMIESKCKPYLKDIMMSDVEMWSGRRKDDKWFIGKVRKDRKPRDTPIEIHKMMDSMFLKKFGFRARSNAVFTVGDIDTAKEYGLLYAIYPIGPYKFVYSRSIADAMWEISKEKWEEENSSMAYESYVEMKLLEILDTYKNKDIVRAIQSGNEIMLNCKSYIGISQRLIPAVRMELNRRG